MTKNFSQQLLQLNNADYFKTTKTPTKELHTQLLSVPHPGTAKDKITKYLTIILQHHKGDGDYLATFLNTKGSYERQVRIHGEEITGKVIGHHAYVNELSFLKSLYQLGIQSDEDFEETVDLWDKAKERKKRFAIRKNYTKKKTKGYQGKNFKKNFNKKTSSSYSRINIVQTTEPTIKWDTLPEKELKPQPMKWRKIKQEHNINTSPELLEIKEEEISSKINTNLSALQEEARKATKNKTIKTVQKKINHIVNPQIRDINVILNYDTITDLPWINNNRPVKERKLIHKQNLTTKEKNFWEQRMTELMELGHITEINEDEAKHIIPTFLVPKDKNSTFREILDFSYLNTFVKNISANLPTYPEIQELTEGYPHFAKIDLQKAYQRIILGKKIRPYACMRAKNGKVYSWKRLPFGLNIAPAVYQIFMERLLPLLVFILPLDLENLLRKTNLLIL